MPRIVIIGVGALGSHVLLFSRNLAVDFRLVDFDRIEAKNEKSQFHTKMGRGKNKVQAVAQAMQGMFGLKVNDLVPHRLTADNVSKLLGDADLVVDCVDNGETRKLIQDFVRANSIPCVHGGLSADGLFGVVRWDEEFTISYAVPGTPTCEDGDHLPLIALASAALAEAIKGFMADGPKHNASIQPGAVQKYILRD